MESEDFDGGISIVARRVFGVMCLLVAGAAAAWAVESVRMTWLSNFLPTRGVTALATATRHEWHGRGHSSRSIEYRFEAGGRTFTGEASDKDAPVAVAALAGRWVAGRWVGPGEGVSFSAPVTYLPEAPYIHALGTREQVTPKSWESAVAVCLILALPNTPIGIIGLALWRRPRPANSNRNPPIQLERGGGATGRLPIRKAD